jgi:hypothetical protein
MLHHILPRQIDNTYDGHRLGVWLFVPVLVLKLLMSVDCIFIGEIVARDADGIPLDSYTRAGADAVVSLLAAWGLGHLVIVLLCAVALVRYRSLVPFLFGVLLVEHVIRKKVILAFLPIVKFAAAPATIVNATLLTLMAAGLVLSLWRSADVLRGVHAVDRVR